MWVLCLFLDQQLVYEGPKSSFTAGDLKPVSTHTFCIRAKTEGDEGSYSRVVSASTPESGTVEPLLAPHEYRVFIDI